MGLVIWCIWYKNADSCSSVLMLIHSSCMLITFLEQLRWWADAQARHCFIYLFLKSCHVILSCYRYKFISWRRYEFAVDITVIWCCALHEMQIIQCRWLRYKIDWQLHKYELVITNSFKESDWARFEAVPALAHIFWVDGKLCSCIIILSCNFRRVWFIPTFYRLIISCYCIWLLEAGLQQLQIRWEQ